jgi:acyl-ACP thioesterase
VTAGDRVLAEAAAVWVYIESAGGRPQPLEPDFFEIYGRAAQDRRVSGRLRHRRPEPGALSRPWPLRDSDFDVLDHVNNARYFEAVEDELATRFPGFVVGRAEMEFRGAVERGVAIDLLSEAQQGEGVPAQLAAWLVSDGTIRASALVIARARA